MKEVEKNKGITLIALVVTIVILIILATISINLILGDGGLVSRSQKSGEEYKIAGAREKLDITLGDAQIEKRINKKYNQNEFLDEFITKSLPQVKIQGDIAIVEGYAFEMDRSVPKIGKYIGKEEELVFPELDVKVVKAEDNRTAIITITAKEETNGINKIEIWQEGFVIKKYPYENIKEEIRLDYEATQNGKYMIKAYGELVTTQLKEVNGLIVNVKYSPNGNEEYKKEHKVIVTADETIEKIKSIKYQWLQTTAKPTEESFTESCNNGDTITKNEITGEWYLWTLLETESGKNNIGRSEIFNFDNSGPNTTLTSIPVSETAFTLNATAHDNETKVVKYEFYANDTLQTTIDTEEETASFTVTDMSTGNTNCYVIVTDALGNTTKATTTGTTKLYAWERWSAIETKRYNVVQDGTDTVWNRYSICSYTSYKICSTTGDFEMWTPSISADPIGRYVVVNCKRIIQVTSSGQGGSPFFVCCWSRACLCFETC